MLTRLFRTVYTGRGPLTLIRKPMVGLGIRIPMVINKVRAINTIPKSNIKDTTNPVLKSIIHQRSFVKQYSTKLGKKEGILSKIKFALIKQNRPFNADEISAFLSWIVMGNFMLVLIGTTTFIGSILYLVNFFGDGELNKAILKRLLIIDNRLKVNIDHPNFAANWQDGMIRFKNIVIESSNGDHYLQYILKVDEINVTLSLRKWIAGKGLIQDVEINGLDGDVYLKSNDFMVDDSFHDAYELENFKVTHSKILFHDDHMFSEPLELVLFNCDMDRLRRNWIVYDFLDANSMFGSLGGSLFTLHKRQNQLAHFSGVDSIDHDEDEKLDNNLWKKITRLRVDMLDLSYMNNNSSKISWIESGKAELIFDIMLPTDEEVEINKQSLDFSWDTVEQLANRVKTDAEIAYKKLIGDYVYEEVTPLNKYVVIDMKINFYELSAREVTEAPVSSLTNQPYISLHDLQSLVTFINDEKFGLSSPKFNENVISDTDDAYYENSDLDFDDSEELEIDTGCQLKSLPPIKFRIVQNLNNFEYLDLPALLSCATMRYPDSSDVRAVKCFQNTNIFIDACMHELLMILMVYKHEIQGKMIDMYAKRSGFEILFNNFILGNLILVGLGTFVI